MCRCTSSTTASVKNPRATPDWLRDHHDGRPARLQRADRVDGPGIELDPFGAIEVADFFDEVPSRSRNTARRAQARRRGSRHSIRRVASSTRSDGNAAHARGDRADTRAACTGGTRPDGVRTATSGVAGPALAGRGRQRSSVGPNTAVTVTPSAAARCMRARVVRHERAAVQPARRPAPGGRSADEIDRPWRAACDASSTSSAVGAIGRRCRRAPSRHAVVAQAAPRAANASGGHRFADPYAAPGASATSGARPSQPAAASSAGARARAARRRHVRCGRTRVRSGSRARRPAAGSTRSDGRRRPAATARVSSDAAPVGAVAPALAARRRAHASQRRLKRVRQQDRGRRTARGSAPRRPRGQGDDVVDVRHQREERRDRRVARRRQSSASGTRPADVGDRRQRHHRVAQPVGRERSRDARFSRWYGRQAVNRAYHVRPVKIALLQINPTVGDLAGNARLIADAAREAADARRRSRRHAGARARRVSAARSAPERRLRSRSWDALARSRATLAGGPPCSSVFRSRIRPTKDARSSTPPRCCASGRVGQRFRKSLLPTYDVFDEDRYFEPFHGAQMLDDRRPPARHQHLRGRLERSRLLEAAPLSPRSDRGAGRAPAPQAIVNLSASPFSVGKHRLREQMLGSMAAQAPRAGRYVNQVGGNDDLVFDGRSSAFNAAGATDRARPRLRRRRRHLSISTRSADRSRRRRIRREVGDLATRSCSARATTSASAASRRVVLGLSGGIDSALTAAIAAEARRRRPRARRPDAVAVSRAAAASTTRSTLARQPRHRHADAADRADAMQRHGRRRSRDAFARTARDVTEENIQARIRGNLLMALSNKRGALLLTTGNKSELAVGYCTLYGDMSGGLAVIADVPKTMVYRVARWLNAHARAARSFRRPSLTKAPSAELRPEPDRPGLAAALRRPRRHPAAPHRAPRAGRRQSSPPVRRRHGPPRPQPRAAAPNSSASRRRRPESDRPRVRHGLADADCREDRLVVSPDA